MINIKPAVQVIHSHLQSSGYFTSTGIGEPRQPPSTPHACVALARRSHPMTTLNGTIERRAVIVRIYDDFLAEPYDDTEFRLDEAVNKVEELVYGDFTLGGTVRNVEPTESGAEFGTIQIGTTLFRVVDITITMTIDDSATYVA